MAQAQGTLRTLVGIELHFDDGTTERIPAQALINWRAVQNRGGGGGNRFNWIEADECPEHGPWKLVPAGYSEAKQKEYPAFWGCEKGCNNRPGRDWVKDNPPEETLDGNLPWS